jgi:hypothetical protein
MPKMNIKNFNHLPLDEKTNYLWDNGVCLSQRSILPIINLKKWEMYVDTFLMQLLYRS